MGCGFEEPDARAAPWSPDAIKPRLKVCPGYTTNLPEVIEASHARFFMEKGSLPQWSDEPITEHTRHALMILASACASEQQAAHEEREKKGRAR